MVTCIHLDNKPLAENGKAPFENYCKFTHNSENILHTSFFFSLNTSNLILNILFNIVYFGLLILTLLKKLIEKFNSFLLPHHL